MRKNEYKARFKLAEVVIILSILYNVEAFQVIKINEIKELESIQHSILTSILDLPKSTPYCSMLMEVGWWSMEERIAYKRLMLYQSISKSDKMRTIRKILKEQMKEERETT